MSEMRQNMLTGEWVIYAENRQNRPYDFLRPLVPKEKNSENCPFCGGHENQTPLPILQHGNKGDWKLRVFDNRFPVVSKEHIANEQILKEQILNEETGVSSEFYECKAGLGRHEVLVDTPNHDETIDSFTNEHLTLVLKVLQERAISISSESSTKYLQIFKNCGANAGMSLAHSHWQLVGLPIVPRRIQLWQERSLEYHKKNGGCMLCDIMSYEMKQQIRILFENEHFVSFAPYAGRFSYEAYIVPKKHISFFSQIEYMDDLGEILLRLVKRLAELRNDIGYNICFMEEAKNRFSGLLHWHIEIYPRIGGFAGMEFATETYINSVMPETAAKFYRKEEL